MARSYLRYTENFNVAQVFARKSFERVNDCSENKMPEYGGPCTNPPPEIKSGSKKISGSEATGRDPSSDASVASD